MKPKQQTNQDLSKSILKKIVSGRPLVFLGVGSEFHGDDGWSFHLIKKINSLSKKDIHALWAETVPENYIAPLERLKPKQVIICDSADFNAPAGTLRLLKPDEVKEQPVAFTHRMPLTSLASMIAERCKCKVDFLLMQPSSIEFNSKMSKEVKRSLRLITKQLLEYIGLI